MSCDDDDMKIKCYLLRWWQLKVKINGVFLIILHCPPPLHLDKSGISWILIRFTFYYFSIYNPFILCIYLLRTCVGSFVIPPPLTTWWKYSFKDTVEFFPVLISLQWLLGLSVYSPRKLRPLSAAAHESFRRVFLFYSPISLLHVVAILKLIGGGSPN